MMNPRQFSGSIIATLYRTEMRMALRDRRTIVAAVLLPLLVMPLMLFSTTWTAKKREQKLQATVYRCAVAGSQADTARALLDATRKRTNSNQPAGGKHPFQFVEITPKDASAALAKGDLHLILEGLTAAEARLNGQSAKTNAPTKSRRATVEDEEDGEPREKLAANTPVLRIVFRADRDDSAAAMKRLRDALLETRRAQRAELLQARGFAFQPEQTAAISVIDLASKGQVAGLTLGRMLSLLFMFFMLVGGAVVATDLLAGEKERGTLETLLTTAASRAEIVLAKHLVILTVALLITLIQAGNLLVYVGFKFIPAPADFAAAVPPPVAALLLFLYLPVAALAASVLLLASGCAKSYKEAQLYFFPVLALGILPTLAPFLPGLPLRSAIVLVPVANVALAAKEILIGAFDWPMIALSWLVTLAAAVWTTRWSVRLLSRERLVTAQETDAVEFAGGPALFSRRVLRWFAVLWGALLMVSGFTADLDLRAQLLINLVVLFFGASVLMVQRYRLDPRDALALRAPKPVVWLAVLFGIPSGMLTGIGLFRLANLFVPVPQKMLESFSQALAPQDLPLAQMLFFMAVLPGIFEEITFRGVLLYGLRRRLRPLPLALVIGLIFGLFHVSLFRLAPTACLGFLFALATMLTGSIFPAMLWHAGNNALGILAMRQQIPLEDLEPQAYVIGAAMLAGVFWILWRNRTPYPDLKGGFSPDTKG